MTPQHKRVWLEMRTRFFEALLIGDNIRKQDLIMCHKLHLMEFGEPKARPTITCCIEQDRWLVMISNLNKAYNKKIT